MTRVLRAPAGEQREDGISIRHEVQPRDRSPARRREDETPNEIPSQPEPESSPHASPHSYPAHVLSSLTLRTPQSKTHTHIIPPKKGHAFLLKAGASFRIVDLHGAQVVDLMAWTSPGNPSGQHSSMSYTRYNISGSAPPQIGEHIYTNLGQAMLRLTADTVKTHDLLYMACNPSFYANMRLPGHANCAENISAAVTAAGAGRWGNIAWNDVVDPFNVFQNTPYYSLKALGASKAGNYCEFENVLGRDVVVGLSCCPFEGDGFNGGRVTEVAVVTEGEGEG